MAKAPTRYDEVGNAVIREARPAANVRTAPRDVKAKGAFAVAAWNAANKRQPGKTGDEAMKVALRGVMKQGADKRAKKTIASTARSFTGGTLNDALSANNTPKVAADAPLTQKRAAVASGMAARAANRVEAGSSDGGPKRRAAERFARIARGEKPFGGAAVAETKPTTHYAKVSKAEAAFNKGRSATPKTKGLPPNERVAKLAGTVDARVRAKGSWGTDDVARRNSRIDRIVKASEAVERKPVVDPLKVIERRNETARSHAEVAKATGSKSRAAIGKDLVARNERDLANMGGAKPAKSARAEKAAATRARNREVGLLQSRIDNAKASLSIGKPTPADIDRTNTLVRSLEMKISEIKTKGMPAKRSSVAVAAEAGAKAPPSFIDKVNAAAEASAKARKNAPKPPATPPGPRGHWNRIGSKPPAPKDLLMPGPGQPAGTLTNAQKMEMVKRHGLGGAMVASQFPTHPAGYRPSSGGVTNDSAMGMKPPTPPAQPPASGRKTPTWGQINTGLAVVGTGVAAAQAFNAAKQEGKSTGNAVASGAVAAAPGALLIAGQPVGSAMSRTGGAMMKIGGELIDEGTNINFMNWASNWFLAKTGLATAGAGAAVKVVGEGLKVAGKVAAPAMAAWGAYQGAKEDDNKVRGAVRGAMRSLDPSAIVTGIGAGTGLMKDGRGLGERAYDAAFGGPTQGRVSAVQAQAFAKADANYDHMGQGQPQATGERPGWSPEARIAAAQARGAVNLPYGGDPTQAPGYQPPATAKGKRPY